MNCLLYSMLSSYITGMIFMLFFGHIIFGVKDPDNHGAARFMGGLFWPPIAIGFIVVRFYRGLDSFFNFEGDK